MIILSAHDTTITMLLSALNLEQDEAPPFASTLIFEVWSAPNQPYVKLLYNDVELDLHDFCFDLPGNATLACDFKTFKKRLLQGTHENTMLECRNTTTTVTDDEDEGEAMQGSGEVQESQLTWVVGVVGVAGVLIGRAWAKVKGGCCRKKEKVDGD
jgi:hypothetical protein